VVIYTVILAAVLFVILLPLSYYSDYVRPHQYGLSIQELSRWFTTVLKEFLITLIVGVICVVVIYYLIKKSPKRWWLYTSLLTLPFIVLSILITPLWIEPLFNKFGPMKNKALEAQIVHLADRAGISDSRVFEVEKSQDTSTVNAYVTGFGSTKRIVLWDTIIDKLEPDELLFVMGHEMGHYVLHHIEKLIVYQFALSFLLFLFLNSASFFIRKYKKQLHVKSLVDIASLPLLLLMAHLFFLATDPISNAYSRHFEHEADRFGLEITQNNEAAAEAFVKLQQENLGNPFPGPLFVLWRSTHPPLGERIQFCNSYRPWEEEQPLKYQRYIQPAP
jgi:STE24 endopeptidase